jgi:hypothetical protein
MACDKLYPPGRFWKRKERPVLWLDTQGFTPTTHSANKFDSIPDNSPSRRRGTSGMELFFPKR